MKLKYEHKNSDFKIVPTVISIEDKNSNRIFIHDRMKIVDGFALFKKLPYIFFMYEWIKEQESEKYEDLVKSIEFRTGVKYDNI
jgi:hypothetical protein